MIKGSPRIYVGCDHAGYSLKKELSPLFFNYQWIDCGVHNENPANYADIAHAVASKVQKDPESLGILICGTGIGVSIAANRHKGIRAALCHNKMTAHYARAHDDANILALGARVLTRDEACACVQEFLSTPFEGGRHIERIQHIELEEKR